VSRPLAKHGVVQAYDEEWFHNAVFSGDAPLASYSLTTLALGNPATRVRWASNSITITATTTGAVRGEVFVVPVSNATTITLNGVNIPVAQMRRSRIPKTTIADLTLIGAAATASSWTMTFSGPDPITLGGAILLYGPIHHILEDFLAAGPSRRNPVARTRVSGQMDQKNDYLTRYLLGFKTIEQIITLNHYETSLQSIADFEDWFDGSWGGGFPSLLWADVDTNDAYFGTWDPTFEVRQLEAQLHEVSIKFYEFSKGKPV
jgi:hypothetical protein